MASLKKLVPSTSKAKDAVVNAELTKLYAQIDNLISVIGDMQKKIDSLEGK